MDFGFINGTNIPFTNNDPYSGTFIIGRKHAEKNRLVSRLLLENIHVGHGCILFDAYGQVSQTVLRRIPPNRWNDVILVRPYEGWPVSVNPFYNIPPERHSLVARRTLATFKNIYYPNAQIATTTFDDYITYGMGAILESREPTLLSLMRFFSDKSFRQGIVRKLNSPILKTFWENNFENKTEKLKEESTQSTLTKLRAIVFDPAIRNILGQYKPTIELQKVFDKILIVDLSISKIGIENTKLLGSLLMSELQHAILSRTGDPYYCYVVGCKSDYFAQHTMVQMLDTPEECKTAFVFADTYLADMDRSLQNALLGTAENLVCFRIGVRDAAELLPEFEPDNTRPSLFELCPHQPRIRSGLLNEYARVPELDYPVFESKEVINRSQEKYGKNPKYIDQTFRKFMKVS